MKTPFLDAKTTQLTLSISAMLLLMSSAFYVGNKWQQIEALQQNILHMREQMLINTQQISENESSIRSIAVQLRTIEETLKEMRSLLKNL